MFFERNMIYNIPMGLVYVVRVIRNSTNGVNENFVADDEAAWTAAKGKLGV